MKKCIIYLAISFFLLVNAQFGLAHEKVNQGCLTCHDFAGGAGLHTQAGHSSCTSCHVTAGDDVTTAAQCAVCHPAGNTGSCNLVKKHTNGNCMTCHGDATAVTEVCASSSCPAAKVLGTEDPGLAKLRDFRDKVLAKSALGRKIIGMYYTHANSINDALDESPKLKAFSYKALQSFIPVAELLL